MIPGHRAECICVRCEDARRPPPPPPPLTIEHDKRRDLVTIEGIVYSGELFRQLGVGPVGSTFRIAGRSDGVVWLQAIYPRDGLLVHTDDCQCMTRGFACSCGAALEAQRAKRGG